MMSVFSPDGAKLYVVNAKAADIAVVDPATGEVGARLPGGQGAMAFVPTADWSEAWVTAPGEDKIRRIELASGAQLAELEVPGEPHGMVLSPDGGALYVVQRKLNQIAEIDPASGAIVRTAPVGQRPDMLAISPDGASLFVTSRDENKLLKLSTGDLSVQGEATTDAEPHGVAWRPS